jgi:hypothetical protein
VGTVVTFDSGHGSLDSTHERSTRNEIARRLAALKHFEFGGDYARARRYSQPLYLVPRDTLCRSQLAGLAGVDPADPLFGGVVPHAFVATKAITHPLPRPDAAAPKGWSEDFGRRVAPVVLRGFTAFDHESALAAGRTLLRSGAVRVKRVCATGGQGQTVAADLEGLHAVLDTLSAQELATEGVVLEENLEALRTWGIGQTRLGASTISYYGVQRMVRNHHGEQVYGGSDLSVVRGGFDALLRQPLPRGVRLAVRLALCYHTAAQACFEGFFATRANYDVLLGVRPNGERCAGVLEQSWRVGGATGAEVAALEHFAAKPRSRRVRASTFEVYDRDGGAPPQADVYFQGTDPQAGPLLKYALLHHDDDDNKA